MSDARWVKMFRCDCARICRPGRRMFLIIGNRRNTKDNVGQWYHNGKPINFEYVEERVIASGDTNAELLQSARKYKRLARGGPDAR